ncbi:MAG: hypothetical protein J7598_20895 [Mitsuaria chitosanitabida]|nr:hypothetical protein [Roseateles chitosanitabidus]
MRAVLLSLLTLSTLSLAEPKPDVGYVPPNGFVPTAEAAIEIAVAVWKPIYGAKEIDAQRPFKATLVQGVWRVEGSLPRGSAGGVAEARIAKADGRVIYVMHGK